MKQTKFQLTFHWWNRPHLAFNFA